MQKMLSSWILLVILAMVWGSSFILMKLGMYDEKGAQVYSSVQVGALRMLIAAIVLSPFALKSIKLLREPRNVLFLAIVGFCGNFFPAFLFTFAETKLSSGMAGMLNSFTSIFTVLIGFLVFGVRLKLIQLLGVLTAMTGLYFMTLYKTGISGNVDIWHMLAILLATLLYGISLNTIRHKLQHIRPIETTSLAFFIVGFPALLVSFTSGAFATMSNHPKAMSSLMAITVLSVVGTAFAVIIFNKLIKDTSALFASMVTYLIPIVAVIIGLYHREKIESIQVIAMFIVICGVVLVNVGPVLLNRKE